MGIRDLGTLPMTVEELLEGLDANLADMLRSSLRDATRISVFDIAAHCREDGYEITPRAVQKWRGAHMAELV